MARGLELHPDTPALVTEDGRWTFRELDALSDGYAANLLASGLAPGARVASLLPNCGALFIHYLGLIKAGLVALPLNYRYTSPEIDHALVVSGATALAYDAERAGDVQASERARAIGTIDKDGVAGRCDRNRHRESWWQRWGCWSRTTGAGKAKPVS